MARICERCGRGAMKAMSRSHSNIATIKRQHLNLQTVREANRRMRVCTSCMRTMSKAQA